MKYRHRSMLPIRTNLHWPLRMTLSLLHNFCREIRLNPVKNDGEFMPGQFRFRYGPSFNESNPRQFAIIFESDLSVHDGYELKIVYCSVFEAEGDIPEGFEKSLMIRANAPAIAYPFLRACIAQLTLMAGHRPVVLPSVNFVEKSKDPNSALPREKADAAFQLLA